MSTLRKICSCTIIAPSGARWTYRSPIGWTSRMCLRLDHAYRLTRQQ